MLGSYVFWCKEAYTSSRLENCQLSSRVEEKVEKIKQQRFLVINTSKVMTFLFIKMDCFSIMLSNYCSKEHFST
jgi:hypothetical protein